MIPVYAPRAREGGDSYGRGYRPGVRRLRRARVDDAHDAAFRLHEEVREGSLRRTRRRVPAGLPVTEARPETRDRERCLTTSRSSTAPRRGGPEAGSG